MNTIEQAHELLNEAQEARTGSDVEMSRQGAAFALAMIAVAEQQRIANLITYFQNPGSIPIAIQEQIRQGLGL